MKIKLIVIRTSDMHRLVEFYQLLGATFDYHKHDSSPYHYSTSIGQMVLEIYPLTKNQSEADKTLRLGFEIDSFDEIIGLLKENNISFASEPVSTAFGFMAVAIDPDGRKIELYKK